MEKKVIVGIGVATGIAALIYTATRASASQGFSLKLINAPVEAVLWKGDFAENSFDYDPIADSGWLAMNKSWNYPSDPLGCTTLFIVAIDADNNILFSRSYLGPINLGVDYTYDYETGILS